MAERRTGSWDSKQRGESAAELIRVHIVLTGWLADVAGDSECYLEVPRGSGLRELLDLLCRSRSSRLRTCLFGPDGSLAPAFMIMVNDEPLAPSQWPRHRFHREARLRIVPIVAGG